MTDNTKRHNAEISIIIELMPITMKPEEVYANKCILIYDDQMKNGQKFMKRFRPDF
jgi:hypothetical protein